MDGLLRKNVIATSGKAIEAAGDTDVLLLDKTGTITLGNRMATEFIPAEGITKEQLADAAQLASLADETPEGRSIVVLAKEQFNIRGREMQTSDAEFIPFTAQTRMSGIDLRKPGGEMRSIRKGAAEAIKTFIQNKNGFYPKNVEEVVLRLSQIGSNTAGCCRRQQGPGCDSPQRYCKRRYQATFCTITKNGDKNSNDHG